MRNREDNSALASLISKITADPKGDYDDALFHTLLTASALGKQVILHNGYVEHYGKRYRSAVLDGDGTSVPLKSLILSFADENLEYDGFLLENLIIEKGFIEELISGIDDYMVEAVVDDCRERETEAVILFSEDGKEIRITPSDMNSDYVIHAPLSDDKKSLSRIFKDVLTLVMEKGMHSVSIPCPDNIDPALFSDIALSSVYAFSNIYQDYWIYASFIARSDDELEKMVGSNDN